MNREELNARLRKMEVRGNDYVPVVQRVQGFWEAFPEGTIKTEWLVLEPERCICRAEVIIEGTVRAQGTACEFKGDRGINSTSYIENCETSAVGRALGFFGIGSAESIASAEEMEIATAEQERAEAERMKKQLAAARSKALKAGITDARMFEALQAEFPGRKSSEYTAAELTRAVAIIEGLKGGKNGEESD